MIGHARGAATNRSVLSSNETSQSYMEDFAPGILHSDEHCSCLTSNWYRNLAKNVSQKSQKLLRNITSCLILAHGPHESMTSSTKPELHKAVR